MKPKFYAWVQCADCHRLLESHLDPVDPLHFAVIPKHVTSSIGLKDREPIAICKGSNRRLDIRRKAGA